MCRSCYLLPSWLSYVTSKYRIPTVFSSLGTVWPYLPIAHHSYPSIPLFSTLFLCSSNIYSSIYFNPLDLLPHTHLPLHSSFPSSQGQHRHPPQEVFPAHKWLRKLPLSFQPHSTPLALFPSEHSDIKLVQKELQFQTMRILSYYT